MRNHGLQRVRKLRFERIRYTLVLRGFVPEDQFFGNRGNVVIIGGSGSGVGVPDETGVDV